jgi:aminoglycoside phosphotransferase (APT) family kinase protein
MHELPRGDHDLIEEACARLGLEGASVTALEGGTRNRSYRLSDGERDGVLRVAGAGDEAYAVARAAEHAAQRLAAQHGLAPRLLLSGRGYAVTEYVPNAPWTRERAASPEGSALVGAWLARLHALPVPAGFRQVRFLDSLEAYACRLQEAGPAQQVLQAARRVARELGDFTPALCHNDLHHLNLIDSPRGLVAIDWEYSGAGDPRLDLAGYVAYHALGDNALQSLLGAYRNGGGACHRDELDRARWLFEAVWWAWLELRRSLEGGEPDALASVREGLRLRLADGASP